MQRPALDRFLQRCLFGVVGATTGIAGAQAAILVLRDRQIFDTSPPVSAIAVIAGACAFSALWLGLGSISMRTEAPLGPARRLVLMIALLLSFVVAGALVAILRADREPIEQSFVWMTAVALIAQPAAAVLVVETLRGMFPGTRAWSARRHFGAVAIVWLLLAIVQGSVLWRTWPGAR